MCRAPNLCKLSWVVQGCAGWLAGIYSNLPNNVDVKQAGLMKTGSPKPLPVSGLVWGSGLAGWLKVSEFGVLGAEALDSSSPGLYLESPIP